MIASLGKRTSAPALFVDSGPSALTVSRGGGARQVGRSTLFAGTPTGAMTNTNSGSFGLTITPSAGLTGDFTVEGWIYPSTGASNMRLVNLGSIQTGMLGCYTSSGKLYYDWVGNTSGALGTTTLAANTWSFFQFIRSGMVLMGYINGTAVGMATVTGTIGNTGGYFSVRDSGTLYTTPDLLANIRVSSVARTAGKPSALLTSDSDTVFLLNFSNW